MKINSAKVLILMIVCSLAGLFGYYFLFQNIVKQTKKTSALVNTINLGEQKNSHIGSLRSVVKDTEERRNQIESFLLSSDTEIPFIEQVESLAKSSGLNINTNSISSTAGNTIATKMFRMQIETNGSWSNTMYFLAQLESLPYSIYLQGVTLVKQSAAGKWNTKFDISAAEKI